METVLMKEFFHAATKTTLRLEHRFDEDEQSLGIYFTITVDGKTNEHWYDGSQYRYAAHYFKSQVEPFL